jgi:hypothetical protein
MGSTSPWFYCVTLHIQQVRVNDGEHQVARAQMGALRRGTGHCEIFASRERRYGGALPSPV